MNATYERRKAAGLCPACGGPRDRDGIVCAACIKVQQVKDKERREAMTDEERAYFNHKKLIRTRERNAERRENGLCIQCAAPSPDRWRCKKCREKLYEYKRKNA